jgi:hypothetical protein
VTQTALAKSGGNVRTLTIVIVGFREALLNTLLTALLVNCGKTQAEGNVSNIIALLSKTRQNLDLELKPLPNTRNQLPHPVKARRVDGAMPVGLSDTRDAEQNFYTGEYESGISLGPLPSISLLSRNLFHLYRLKARLHSRKGSQI